MNPAPASLRVGAETVIDDATALTTSKLVIVAIAVEFVISVTLNDHTMPLGVAVLKSTVNRCEPASAVVNV